jgi:hypothetical protein
VVAAWLGATLFATIADRLAIAVAAVRAKATILVLILRSKGRSWANA